MKTIKLYGVLAEKFGRRYKLDVASPAEAIRALCAVVPGFRDFLNLNGNFKLWAGQSSITEDNIAFPCSDSEVIKIVPLPHGAGGGGGLLGIIGGIALITLAIVQPAFLAAYMSASSYAIIGSLGVSMVLGGLSQALTQPPVGNQAAASNASYIFNGASNNIAQGNPVPICYGEMIVGSQVISLGIDTR